MFVVCILSSNDWLCALCLFLSIIHRFWVFNKILTNFVHSYFETRKPTRLNVVNNDASARPPNLCWALCDLELWPPNPQSWPFPALAPWTTGNDFQPNRFVCFQNIVFSHEGSRICSVRILFFERYVLMLTYSILAYAIPQSMVFTSSITGERMGRLRA